MAHEVKIAFVDLGKIYLLHGSPLTLRRAMPGRAGGESTLSAISPQRDTPVHRTQLFKLDKNHAHPVSNDAHNPHVVDLYLG